MSMMAVVLVLAVMMAGVESVAVSLAIARIVMLLGRLRRVPVGYATE